MQRGQIQATDRNPFNLQAVGNDCVGSPDATAPSPSEPLSHIAYLLSLSWDDMQAIARTYLDGAIQAKPQ